MILGSFDGHDFLSGERLGYASETSIRRLMGGKEVAQRGPRGQERGHSDDRGGIGDRIHTLCQNGHAFALTIRMLQGFDGESETGNRELAARRRVTSQASPHERHSHLVHNCRAVTSAGFSVLEAETFHLLSH